MASSKAIGKEMNSKTSTVKCGRLHICPNYIPEITLKKKEEVYGDTLILTMFRSFKTKGAAKQRLIWDREAGRCHQANNPSDKTWTNKSFLPGRLKTNQKKKKSVSKQRK